MSFIWSNLYLNYAYHFLINKFKSFLSFFHNQLKQNKTKKLKKNSCGEGRVMSPDGKGCMDRNECLDLPCLNGAQCVNLEPRLRYRCICPDGFWGENCELIQEGQTLKLSMGALAAILVCLLIILSEHL